MIDDSLTSSGDGSRPPAPVDGAEGANTAAADARPFVEPIRISTGVPGLDEILGGGLPRHRMYLIEGDPGAGKTTLAMQFLLEGVRQGEPGVYATLSETEEELRDVAGSHGWSLDGITICDLQTAEENLK